MASPRIKPPMRRYNSNCLKNETATLPPGCQCAKRATLDGRKVMLQVAHGIPSMTAHAASNPSRNSVGRASLENTTERDPAAA